MRRFICIIVVIISLSYILYTNRGSYHEGDIISTDTLSIDEIVEEYDYDDYTYVDEKEESLDNIIEEVVEVDITISSKIEEEISPILIYDAYELSNLNSEDYDLILLDSPIEGLGHVFVQLEEDYNVNGLFALAVCNLESSLGRYNANTNNFFGFYYGNGYMSFDTPEDGILYFGELLSSSLYFGKSIDEIAAIYCPPNPEWASLIRTLMEQNYNKIA